MEMLEDFVSFTWNDGICTKIKDFRFDESYNFYDKVFKSKINLKIRETGEDYSKMLYHEAVKTGFHDLRNVRHQYLNVCDLPNYNLIKKFVAIQTILLSPICPHVCESIRREQIDSSTVDFDASIIFKARWPAIGEIDDDLITLSEHLTDTTDKFKNHPRSYKLLEFYVGRAIKSNVIKHVTGIISIAKTYSFWQCIILMTMKEIYFKNKNNLPDNEVLSTMFADKAELRSCTDRIMPFVQHFKKKKMKAIGLKALNLTLDFDEFDLFKNNMRYLLRAIHREQNI